VILFFAAQGLVFVAAVAIFVRRTRTVARLAQAAREGLEAAERHDDLAHAAASGAYLLRGLGRLAPPFALAGAIVVMGRGLAGHGGLAALRAGFAARHAVEQAAVAIGLGAATAVACHWAAARLLRRAQEAHGGPGRADRALDRPGGGV
jgi:hypothetical protein